MSQHDLNIANQGFPAFRADLNDALEALGSCQSGISAPSTTYANQLWYDTTNNILKIRNEDNDAWIPIITLDQTTDSVFAVNTANLAYTGTLTGGTDVVNLGSGQFYKDADGKVGIGTNNPIALLDLQGGEIYVSNALGAVPESYDDGQLAAFINEDSLYPTDNRVISFGASPATATNGTGFYASSGYIRSIGNLSLVTNSTEKVRIDGNGNVLIGSETYNGTNTKGVQIGGTDIGAVYVGHVTGTTTGSVYMAYNYNGTAIGSITQSGTTAVAYNTSSDYRLKENIAPMTGALDKVAQLKPVTYNWKTDGSSGQGFIAHELQEVVPDCVTGEKDAVNEDGKPVYQGIDTSFLVATLTAAIQELKAITESQAIEIAMLKESK